MAKKQTFGDKLKKKDGSDVSPVKVLRWEMDENRGTLRCKEELLKLANQNDINNL